MYKITNSKMINGKGFAEHLNSIIKSLVSRLNHTPTLAIITIGDDDASKVYVRNKLKTAAAVGIDAKNYVFNENDYTRGDVHRFFETQLDQFDGVILQLPVPTYVNARELIEMIPAEKDVDGLTHTQIGMLQTNDKEKLIPCTPQGVLDLLGTVYTPKEFTGKHAVIINRSNLVGKPLAQLLLGFDMTVTICHSKTEDLGKFTRDADVLVTAAGVPGLITADMVKEDAIIIDVSMNRNSKGKLCGDVCFDEVLEKVSAITPVPGGVGPMTVMNLMYNTYKAAYKKELLDQTVPF